MIFASLINFVSNSGRRQAIITFNLRGVYSFTLQFLFLKPVIKRNMRSIADELSIQAMDTFSVWTMLTQHFGCTDSILQVHCRTIETFSIRSMITFRFLSLCFLIFFCLLIYSHTVQAFTSGRMITLRCKIAVSEYRYFYSISLALIPLCKGYFLGFFDATLIIAPSVKYGTSPSLVA